MSRQRGRFAPSPTGNMHLGNAWTALLAWLSVRQAGGVMVLRLEDLDPDRSRAAYAAQLLTDLRWLGLDWDEGPDNGGPYGPYCQDERRELYRQALSRLEKAELLYQCYCSRARLQAVASAPHFGEGEAVYPGFCRNLSPALKEQATKNAAWRLKTPPGRYMFQDQVCGSIVQEVSQEVGDFIVRRADGVAAYQLAVVVDDAAMQITEVVRGQDLLLSTPRQLLLYRLLGLQPPVFAHVPLLCAADGRRLAKRNQDLTIASLRARGVQAEEIIGYLAWQAGFLPRRQPIKAKELINNFTFTNLSTEAVFIDKELFF